MDVLIGKDSEKDVKLKKKKKPEGERRGREFKEVKKWKSGKKV